MTNKQKGSNMFAKLKMKLAAKRMQRKKDYAASDKRIRKENTLKRVILWPFRMIGRLIRWIWDTICAVCSWIWGGVVWLVRRIWKWLCSINLVGLLNLALLIAIIVLCSMLILDLFNCYRRPVVVMGPAKSVPIEFTKNTKTKNIPLPMPRNTKKGELPIANVVPTKPSDDPTLREHGDGKIYGDIIIESRAEAIVLKNGAHISGSLYLQHMRKYVLPCNVTIEGNLFLRDVNMVQFCGPFNVKGNIYVSPRSSFGPIPRESHLGGQIIL